jgi:hypothetical protein
MVLSEASLTEIVAIVADAQKEGVLAVEQIAATPERGQCLSDVRASGGAKEE